MLGWADVPDSDWGDFRRRPAVDISSWIRSATACHRTAYKIMLMHIFIFSWWLRRSKMMHMIHDKFRAHGNIISLTNVHIYAYIITPILIEYIFPVRVSGSYYQLGAHTLILKEICCALTYFINMNGFYGFRFGMALGYIARLINRIFAKNQQKNSFRYLTLHSVGIESIQWRHYECDGVSNRRRVDCLHNRLFRRRSKNTSKLRVPGLCEGNSPVTVEIPAPSASNAENVPIWWSHHDHQVTIMQAIWFQICFADYMELYKMTKYTTRMKLFT